MTNSQTHLTGFMIVFMIAVYILKEYGFVEMLTVEIIIYSFVAGSIFSVLPDVDHPNSKVRKKTATLMLIGIISLVILFFVSDDRIYLFGVIFLAIILVGLWCVRHRGVLHTVPAGIFLAFPFFIYNPVVGAFALLGFLLHLVMDV